MKKILIEKDLVYIILDGGYCRSELTSLGKQLYDKSTLIQKTRIIDLRQFKTLYQVITFQTIELYDSSILDDASIYVTFKNTKLGNLIQLWRNIKSYIE